MKRAYLAFILVAAVSGTLLPAGMHPARGEPALVSGWEPPGDPRIFSGENATFLVNCTSPGCATLVFQWSVDGALVVGEADAHFTFYAGTNLAGTVPIGVFVSDGSVSSRKSWNLTVERPIVVLPAASVALAEGEERTFWILGASGRNVSWFLDGADLGMNGTEYVLRADFRSAGTHQLAVSVEGASVHTWIVSVSDRNRPPALPRGRLVQAYAGETVTVKIQASDPDGGALRYQWDLDSDGAAEYTSNTSGNLSHRFAQEGEHRATLTVRDDGGASAAAVYLFDVRERPSQSAWWLPASISSIAALALLIFVAVQARRLSRSKEARAPAGFFAQRKRPVQGTEGGIFLQAEPPRKAPEGSDGPELLQVRSLLPAKRAELEASPGHPGSDIPLSKKLMHPGPPGAASPGRPQSPAWRAGGLRDKGAEGERRAQDTELGRQRAGTRLK